MKYLSVTLLLLTVILWEQSTIEGVFEENRFCCDEIRVIQPGFRPKYCLPVDSCKVQRRKTEIVRLYGCADPTELAGFVTIPESTVITDRTEGWNPFTDTDVNATNDDPTIRETVLWDWNFQNFPGGYNYVDKQQHEPFRNGSMIKSVYAFVGDDKYFVPPYVKLYQEPCRPYDPSQTSYQDIRATVVYNTLDINQYTECEYIVHFSFAKDPYRATLPYFNERGEQEVREQLENPTSTSYFDPVKIGDSTIGYFAFPYFLIVRILCQDEGFYGEEFYNIAISGQYPAVQLHYTPYTTRVHFENPISLTMTSILVRLVQGASKVVVPDPVPELDTRLQESQFYSITNPNVRLCYLNLCHFGYALPQPFLQIATLRVNIDDRRSVAKYEKNLYVSPFHARNTKGTGHLQIAKEFVINDNSNVTQVHPRYFFPVDRQPERDDDLYKENLDACIISEDAVLAYEFDIPASFYLEGREDVLAWALKEMESYKIHLPLTSEDFFVPQYTYGTVPIVAIAGFYQPNLIIFGDPEMDMITLFEWDYDARTDSESVIFENNGACLTDEKYIHHRSVVVGDRRKPMYSMRQKDENRRYTPGRRSYYPFNYESRRTKAIFEIISLEDRLLLKTTSGLIPFYGNSNATKGQDKILKSPPNEKIHRCFKIIRTLKTALPDYDPILAVTYDYSHWNKSIDSKNHDQEVWYGKLLETGLPIEWTELGSKEYQDSITPPIHIIPALTSLETFKDISEGTKICKQVYVTRILPLFPTEQKRTAYRSLADSDRHNCIILDGSPIPHKKDTIQLILEMTFTYYKAVSCNPAADSFKGDCERYNDRKCLRYHYCVNLLSTKKKEPASDSKPSCNLIKEIECKQIPCYNEEDVKCTKTPATCRCPSCQYTTTCQQDHCHIHNCTSCPEIGYYPRRCDCPPVIDDFGNLITAICDVVTAEKECSKCPSPDTDCHFPPFGPCKIGATLFCPDNVQKLRPSPACPKCMQNFAGSLEGDYDYPISERVYLNTDTPKVENDRVLCDEMLKGKTVHDFCKFHVQDIKLFIIAEHQIGKPILNGYSWKIVSVFPKRPCQAAHYERIFLVQSLDASYFGETNLPINKRITCFEYFAPRQFSDLDVTSFIYTRQTNYHLFIYGSKLLHSLDGGYTLTRMRDFPVYGTETNFVDYDMMKILNNHKIRIMAFSGRSEFAFLTTKRELWLGATGSLRQARLRPNAGWSMMSLRLYKNRMGVQEATPFAVIYDSFDNLIELVAIRDRERNIESIIKRVVDVQLMLRNNYMVEKLEEYVNRELILSLRTKTNRNYHSTTVQSPIIPYISLYIHYDIPDLSLYCPFSQIKIRQNYSLTLNRLQSFSFNPPIQHYLIGFDHKPSSLMAYSVSMFSVLHDSFLKKTSDIFYSRVKKDPFEKWRIDKTEEAYIGYIRYLRKDPGTHGVVVDPREGGKRIINRPDSAIVGTDFVTRCWIDYNQIIRMEITFYIKNAQFLGKTDFLVQKLSEIQINVDNGDGQIVQLNTERKVLGKEAAVTFIAHISLFKSKKLIPSFPGQKLLSVPLTYHLIGGFGKCFKLEHWGMVGESLSSVINAGCPPATGLLFDWNSTLYSLNFRSPTLKYGDESYCLGKEQVCFSVEETIVFHFDVLDISNQRYIPFEGKFKLRVIGGGRTKDKIKMYNRDQIDAYNIPGISDISLIWAISPENNETGGIEKDDETQENILNAGVTRIEWSCNTLSPCARVLPRLDFESVFFFKIHITNKGVDLSTLCIHEREFIIMLYGFTPSPEIKLFLTFSICFFLLSIMYIFSICCRRHRKVWRANKLRFMGWLQIIKDTFPKPVKNKADTVVMNRKKDSILLSIQGHLNVPEIVAKRRIPLEEEENIGGSISEGANSYVGSTNSLESEGSDTSLPHIRPRKKGATWTDLIYEQIISQRLLAIVNRNRRMRDHVLHSHESQLPEGDLDPVVEQESVQSLTIKSEEEKPKQVEKKTV